MPRAKKVHGHSRRRARPFPRRLRILGHRFVVKLMGREGMEPPLKRDKEISAAIGRHYFHYGSMYPDDLEIHINREAIGNDGESTPITETYLHEILHALFEYAGLRQWLGGGIKPGRAEEALCQALGMGMNQVLRENPTLTRMYLKDDRKAT